MKAFFRAHSAHSGEAVTSGSNSQSQKFRHMRQPWSTRTAQSTLSG